MYKTRKILIVFILTFCMKPMSSQIWGDIGFGRDQYTIRVLYPDDTNGKLYVGGDFRAVSNFTTFCIATFDGSGWQPLGNGIYNVHTITKFNSQIYAGTDYGVFRWSGSQWDTIAKIDIGAVSCLYVYNNELYAGGVYNTIGGLNSKGLAKWNGSIWQKVGNYERVCHGTILSIIDYNNELYIGGQLTDSLGVPMTISKFDGITWNRITTKFNGGMDDITTMEKYNNKLYVGGTYGKCYGSNFNFIAQYDGTNWSDVGTNGLTGEAGCNGQVWQVKTINSKLYAVGQFGYADGARAQYIASWDGAKWCGYGSGFDLIPTAITSFNNNIYMAGAFWKFQNDSIFRIAKWLGGNYTDTCASPLLVKEYSIKNNIKVYPNPASNTLHIESESDELQNAEIEITNALGQTVLTFSFSSEINISNLAQGYYNLRLTSTDKQIFYSKFVKN